MPVLKREWMTPSVTQRKDEFGNENRTCFKLKARLNDGFTKWTGWFEDREDFDAFLWALVKGTLKYERELWDLSLPNWDPDIGENVTYEFATVTFLTTTGANTYYVPSDWDSSGSKIDCIGGGGGGGVALSAGSNRHGAGGGGGGFGRKLNFSLTPGGTASYSIGVSGVGPTRSSAGASTGGTGGDTFFDNTTYASATVGATGGTGGAAAQNNTFPVNGGVGGTGKGDSSASGGNGGSITTGASNSCRTGGGGAAGFNGNGTSAGGAAGSNVRTNGGSGDAGFGGAGGTSAGVNGVAGTEYQVSPARGSGGGGAGASSGGDGGNGGNYGAAGGGASGESAFNTQIGGSGAQGLIIVEYIPVPTINSLSNMPMLGM